MKTIVVTLLTFFAAVISAIAQDFQGMAVYESKTSTSDFQSSFAGNRDITPEMQKMFEERMKKMFEKTFVLHFNRNASIYKEEEKLDAPGQGNSGFRMASSMMGGGGTQYKNIKEKTYSVDKEVFGKEFLVKDSLPVLEWKMGSETKKIGDYTCYKATAMRKIDQSDFRNIRMKKDDEKKNENESSNKKAEEKSTNFMDQIDMPTEIEITAWYTPEIPVNQGPENYWGLPGLIMEVNTGKTVILCSKVVLNPKDKKEIKAPTKGKAVSQKEFDEIVKKKMEEMREMGGGRGGFQMRVGG
ncbi:MAG: GLPGLI family protein [Bacteroidetes bacterium HGW-Bacteroidetes-23]|nr:MAG: GLPGLI family protein [Bacteroidetes bacterium HGW-Bacteroidetes-23]